MSKRKYRGKKRQGAKKLLKLSHTVRQIYGEVCMSCGSTENIHADHIYPWSKYPKLRFDLNNLQVLCNDCNNKKSNTLIIDYRTEEQKKLFWEKMEEYRQKRNPAKPKKKQFEYPDNYKDLAKQIMERLTDYEKNDMRKGIKSAEQFYKRVYKKYSIMLGV